MVASRATSFGRLGFIAATAALGPSACGQPVQMDPVFIAVDTDFASYRTWEHTLLGEAPLVGHPMGQRWGYRNRMPVAGSYPVGTIIVKEIRTTPVMLDWELFAMVKRGGGYNATGATDWEYFTLRLGSDGKPFIVQRGESPSTGDVYAGSTDGCNTCHAAPGSEATDHILDVPFRPPP